MSLIYFKQADQELGHLVRLIHRVASTATENTIPLKDGKVIKSHILGVFSNLLNKEEVRKSLAVEVTTFILRLLNGEEIHTTEGTARAFD